MKPMTPDRIARVVHSFRTPIKGVPVLLGFSGGVNVYAFGGHTFLHNVDVAQHVLPFDNDTHRLLILADEKGAPKGSDVLEQGETAQLIGLPDGPLDLDLMTHLDGGKARRREIICVP